MADPGYRWSDGHPQRRAAWVAHLRDVGPVRCGCVGQCLEHECQCSVLIVAGEPFHLGHNAGGIRAGDNGQTSTPWCPRCNLVDAANATNGKHGQAVTSYEW